MTIPHFPLHRVSTSESHLSSNLHCSSAHPGNLDTPSGKSTSAVAGQTPPPRDVVSRPSLHPQRSRPAVAKLDKVHNAPHHKAEGRDTRETRALRLHGSRRQNGCSSLSSPRTASRSCPHSPPASPPRSANAGPRSSARAPGSLIGYCIGLASSSCARARSSDPIFVGAGSPGFPTLGRRKLPKGVAARSKTSVSHGKWYGT
jgi:hypothetical protein